MYEGGDSYSRVPDSLSNHVYQGEDRYSRVPDSLSSLVYMEGTVTPGYLIVCQVLCMEGDSYSRVPDSLSNHVYQGEDSYSRVPDSLSSLVYREGTVTPGYLIVCQVLCIGRRQLLQGT